MEGIITFTVETDEIDSEVMAKLNGEVSALGLKTTLPQTEGGDMPLPDGTYGAVIQIDDLMEQIKRYYRSLVAIMRKLKIKGKYFINISEKPAFVCGEL